MRSKRHHSLPPIPGTERRARGLFVSRWGALLERPSHGPCRRFDDAVFTPRAGELLFRVAQQGWRIYLISNEDAVARGKLSDTAWNEFQTSLHAHLTRLGIPLARDYACLDHPDGKGAHKRDSVFLFPNTGALYHALQEDGIDLKASWLISDDVHELAAGSRAGMHCAVLGRSTRVGGVRIEVECDLQAGRLCDALGEIAGMEQVRAS